METKIMYKRQINENKKNKEMRENTTKGIRENILSTVMTNTIVLNVKKKMSAACLDAVAKRLFKKRRKRHRF